ncbi:MAG TPA: 50S ribosomal protein L29 [Gammaproteobacteria bacterium]|jgi:large subunit ribosomal protein L29|nr:50S ribosomal protein L29 [Gammaproteobacteria bacterium]
MEMNDIRKKNDKELREEIGALRKEQFNMRMQAAAGQAPRAHQIRNVRKDVARLKTAQNERVKAGKK